MYFERQASEGVHRDRADRCASAKELVSGLFTDWYGHLVRYAFRATGSLETAEDIVQTSFTELYRTLLEGKTVNNPKGWTLCVLRRDVVDRIREERRHGGAFVPLSDIEHLAGSLPQDAVGWAQFDLSRLLSVLTTREEEVLLLRAQALKYRQIAAELKIGLNSVKTLLARAMRKMHEASAPAAAARKGSRRDGESIPTTLQ
jgi:RNA polymerase sigma factor (sigma-70 family)